MADIYVSFPSGMPVFKSRSNQLLTNSLFFFSNEDLTQVSCIQVSKYSTTEMYPQALSNGEKRLIRYSKEVFT